MEKDKIFFAESGLTTTSANYVANLAKEAYKNIERSLDSVSFYDKKISIIGADTDRTVSIGWKPFQLENVKDSLHQIAQLKSLIAWLREAISAKERLINEAKRLSDRECAAAIGVELPDSPDREDYMTEEEYIATLNIKQRNQYLYLDTVCATIGSFIHPSQPFATAREELSKVLNEPYKVSGGGRDTIIYSYSPSCQPEEIEDLFFSLQNEYRGYQAQLNSMKHEMELALQKDKRDKDSRYQNECILYQAQVQKISADITAYKNLQIERAQSLKITIPNSLEDIYKKVSSLGKKK